MKLEEFYKEFNKIVANHSNENDTTKKLNGLLEDIKGTDIDDKVEINIEELVKDLEEQRKKSEESNDIVDDYEEQEHSYYDEYIDSYESSYDDYYESSY